MLTSTVRPSLIFLEKFPDEDSGGGTIDGNGQAWYDAYAANIYTLRPTLIGVVGLHDSTFSNLLLRYSPTYYHFVTNSTNVVFDNINIAGGSVSANPAKNTDGWDTYRVEDVTIQNSIVNNGDGQFSVACSTHMYTDLR